MTATPSPSPVYRITDPSTGFAIPGAKLYTYDAGTTTPATTWSDADKLSAHTNPVVMDPDGQAQIFIDGAYKFIARRPDGTLLYEIDDVVGGTSLFDKPASGITILPFDDITGPSVQDALEQLGALRLKIDDTLTIKALLDALGLIAQPGDFKFFPSLSAPTGWLRCNAGAVSRATYPDLFARLVTGQGFAATAFTVTLASPGVFTKASHGFNGGERIRLSTTGALPTGLSASVDYYVKVINANTFNVSTTFGGASVNTSGSQSGTHSYTQSLFGLGDGSTTFNVPDETSIMFRGLKSGTTLAAWQAETIGPHLHTGTTDSAGDHFHSFPVASTDSPDQIAAGGGTPSGNNALTSTNGAHTHPFTTNNNSGAENVPKHATFPLYIKT